MKKILQITITFITAFTWTACSSDNDIDKKSMQIILPIAYKDSFSQKNHLWKSYEGRWDFSGSELIQESKSSSFPLILLEDKQYENIDISVDFKPISGQIDASGGIVFRAKDADNYYIVRANALENNYRLYTFVNGMRSQIASATVNPPSIGKYHTMRVVALGTHIQAYLDGKLYIDHQDKTFAKGYTGLWTKADSVTAFDNFMIKAK